MGRSLFNHIIQLQGRALAILFAIAMLAPTLATAQSAAPDSSNPYPGTPFDQLPAELQSSFRSLAEGELCPCDDSVVSLDECLQAEDACSIARAGAFAAMQALFQGRSQDAARTALTEQVEAFRRVHTFEPIPSQTKGPSSAAVEIIEFADFECPFCKNVSEILHDLHEANPSVVRVGFRHFPLSHHRNAEEAAMATIAAGEQGKFWEFHDALFARQAELQRSFDAMPMFREIAESLDLDVEKFSEDMQKPSTYRAVRQQKDAGAEIGIAGTPTVFINGRIYLGELTPEGIAAAVEDARSEQE